MKYIIQTQRPNGAWERSYIFSDEYTQIDTRALLVNCHYGRLGYRITPLKPKIYRRHAAITQLKLRGAHAMLESARKHVVQSVNSSFDGAAYYEAFRILTDARLAVTRQLEAL